jgi:hypothetical protein
MTTYNDIGVLCDSQAQNRVIDDVVSYATYLDSTLPPIAPLAMIHKRVPVLWRRFSERWEWRSVRSRWVWRDWQWVER